MVELPYCGTLGHCCTTAPPPDLASLQVGNWEYLKNYRKGLQHQLQRSQQQLIETDDAAKARDLEARVIWVQHKQYFLDTLGEMIHDRPGPWMGKEREDYGSLLLDARRFLSRQEINWNQDMIEAEGATAATAPPARDLQKGIKKKENKEKQRQASRRQAHAVKVQRAADRERWGAWLDAALEGVASPSSDASGCDRAGGSPSCAICAGSPSSNGCQYSWI